MHEWLAAMTNGTMLLLVIILAFLFVRMLFRDIFRSLYAICTLHRRPVDWSWRPPPPGWSKMWRHKT